MVQISRFELDAVKHPTDATPSELTWKVLVKVRFQSDDPRDWGELRAYGATWTRVINRTHEVRNVMSEDAPKPDPLMRSQPRREERCEQLETHTSLPFWGLSQGPRKHGGLEWRLGNDQHMDILYADVVPGVPRSNPRSTALLPDDQNPPNDLRTESDAGDFDGLGREWHVIARDEPMSSSFQLGDFVEYWHRGEFQIRDPRTRQVLSERKQLFLRVSGSYPEFTYKKHLDTTAGDLPPSWELSILQPGARHIHYPARDLHLPR